jgi:hypothetical protein
LLRFANVAAVRWALVIDDIGRPPMKQIPCQIV